MPHDCERLLSQARAILERYMFDGDTIRDDVAEICMKIDDLLPQAPLQQAGSVPTPIEAAA